MSDNGSTDGSPEEALERYPNARLLRTGGNLGYGGAVNRAVDEYLRTDRDVRISVVVANPDMQWGPRPSTSCSPPRSAGRGRARSGR